MKIVEFYDWMMPYVSHREIIFLNKNGTVRVTCGFKAGSGKHLFYIGEKNKKGGDALFNRMVERIKKV